MHVAVSPLKKKKIPFKSTVIIITNGLKQSSIVSRGCFSFVAKSILPRYYVAVLCVEIFDIICM